MRLIVAIALGVAGLLFSVAMRGRVSAHRDTQRRDPPAVTTTAGSGTGAAIHSESPIRESALGGLVTAIDMSQIAAESETDPLRAQPHPHGKRVCASGCTLSNHPTPRLSFERFRELFARYQELPHNAESSPLNELIYYGPQTARYLESQVDEPVVDHRHREFLSRELSRKTVTLSIRVVDDAGQIRVLLPPTKIPQHVRQVFFMDEFGLQPLVTSGTVKRIGLRSMWQRL